MNTGLKITRLVMTEVGTYDDMFIRSYEAKADQGDLMLLRDLTENGRNLRPATISGVAGRLIRPSSSCSGVVNIANGFDTRRLFFLMEVEFPGAAGVSQVEWLSGYTDQVGVSTQRGLDHAAFNPNMRLFFNNALRGRRASSTSGFGNRQATSVSNSHQLILAEYRPSMTSLNNTDCLMRPSDVFRNNSTASLREVLNEPLFDSRVTHGPDAIQTSNRANAMPTTYMSRLLTAYRDHGDTDSHDPAAMYSDMAAEVRDDPITQIRSLTFLQNVSELRTGGSVTWRELLDLDSTGTLESRAELFLALSDRTRAELSVRGGENTGWGGNTEFQIVASMLSQSIPALMMSNMLTGLDFSVTNRTLDGRWLLDFSGWETFNDGDATRQLQLFESELIHSVMPSITLNNEMPLTVHGHFDVFGETSLSVQIDGGIEYPFVAPSFCDGLFAPVRASNLDVLDNFSNTLSSVMVNLQTVDGAPTGYEPDMGWDAGINRGGARAVKFDFNPLGGNNANSGTL